MKDLTKSAKAASAKRAAKTTAKKTARKVKAITAFAHFAIGSSPYTGVTGSARGALLLAAMVVSGFASYSKAKGFKTTAKDGNRALLAGLVGTTPYNYHKSQQRIVDNQLTAAGATFLRNRVSGESPSMRTDKDIVADIVNAMRKGGKVEALAFTRKIAG